MALSARNSVIFSLSFAFRFDAINAQPNESNGRRGKKCERNGNLWIKNNFQLFINVRMKIPSHLNRLHAEIVSREARIEDETVKVRIIIVHISRVRRSRLVSHLNRCTRHATQTEQRQNVFTHFH